MPFVETDPNAPIPPRHAVSQAEQDTGLLWVRQQQREIDLANQVIVGVLVLLAVIVAAVIYRRRHKLAAAADQLVVEGGAAAIKGARAGKQSWGNFWRRAKAAADH